MKSWDEAISITKSIKDINKSFWDDLKRLFGVEEDVPIKPPGTTSFETVRDSGVGKPSHPALEKWKRHKKEMQEGWKKRKPIPKVPVTKPGDAAV